MAVTGAQDWKALLARVNPSYEKALVFAVWGAVGAAAGSILGELANPDYRGGSVLESILLVSIWFGVIGAGIGFAILVGYSHYMKRGWQITESVRGGMLPGLIGGAVAGGLAQFFYGSLGRGESLRVICWGIAGGLLGLGLSYRIQNLGTWRGFAGGAVGGVLGGIVFVLMGQFAKMGGAGSRMAGLAAIGFCIGLMLMFAEAFFREAWLEVRYGPKETRNVSLGAEPVSIGGDINGCTVYARDVAGVAFRYKLDHGHITCEDVAKGQIITVQPGHSQPVGNLTVTVKAAGAAAATHVVAPTQVSSAGAMGGFKLRLSTGRSVALADGVKLSTTDVPGLQATSGTVVAEVGRNPNDPNVLGLKNMSRNGWTATLANRDQLQIAPGRNVRVAAGTKIAFGSVSADIENG